MVKDIECGRECHIWHHKEKTGWRRRFWTRVNEPKLFTAVLSERENQRQRCSAQGSGESGCRQWGGPGRAGAARILPHPAVNAGVRPVLLLLRVDKQLVLRLSSSHRPWTSRHSLPGRCWTTLLLLNIKQPNCVHMETTGQCFVRTLLLFHVPNVFFTAVLGQSSMESVVVAVYNITAPIGSQVVLQCHSQRMVWTQDSLKDRQRVVHWDLFRSTPDYTMERILDMFSAGEQRIYNSYNKGRISMPMTAFHDGNFSLIIRDVSMNDRGIYSCNLHHHYCQMFESVKLQLNVTKSPRKQKKFWDGEKAVFVVLLGSTVMLPCENRRQVWTEGHSEEAQQVVHWDKQAPGVRHDQADRLIDMYASGERRQYGPLFLRQKMNISDEAFSLGDFSLTMSNLQPLDEGIYSCHLHHHYCGLNERRVFQVKVGPPLPPDLSDASHVLPNSDPGTNAVEVPRVINVILPEQRSHFLQQLGYILAILLFIALIVVSIVLLTRRHKKRGLNGFLNKLSRYYVSVYMRSGHMTNDLEMEVTELKMCNQEEMRLDFKNNILKEKAEMSKIPPAKSIHPDKGNSCVLHVCCLKFKNPSIHTEDNFMQAPAQQPGWNCPTSVFLLFLCFLFTEVETAAWK
ncbi:matrix-remodeling-associated protein 8 [Arapaima gigas]